MCHPVRFLYGHLIHRVVLWQNPNGPAQPRVRVVTYRLSLDSRAPCLVNSSQRRIPSSKTELPSRRGSTCKCKKRLTVSCVIHITAR